jgi:hypothetical protein
MLPEWTVVGFSGHRKLADENTVANGIRNVFQKLAANHGHLAAVSSAASGSDTLFLAEADRREIRYMLIFPFSQERFQQDFNHADWHRVQPFIKKATHREYVAEEESKEAAYMETGNLTVDRADIMVVVWDGKPAAGFGGTGDVVKRVRELNKPLIIIDPATGSISEERLSELPVQKPMDAWAGEPQNIVKEHFQELDDRALLHAPRSRHLVLQIVLAQLAALFVGLTAMALHIGLDPSTVSKYHFALNISSGALELFCLGFAFLSSMEYRKKSDEWMKNRIAAEICRTFLAVWNMRHRPLHFPNLSIRQFDRLCRNLRLIRLLDTNFQPSFEQVRDGYLKERVEDQINFYSSKRDKARENHRWLRFAMIASTFVATCCSILTLVFVILNADRAMIIFKYSSLLFPLVSTASFVLIVTQDYSRRAVRYTEMCSMLEEARKGLRQANTWNSLTRIATETEEKLLQELVEWYSFRRFAGEPN